MFEHFTEKAVNVVSESQRYAKELKSLEVTPEHLLLALVSEAKGVSLKTPEGLATRPTAERVKEAMFSVIQFMIPGSVVLDLFGGTGQLGIEALSRGAKRAIFVDELEKTNATNMLFIKPDEIQKEYPIPSAFEKYVKYVNIKIGQEKFEES